MASWAMLLGGFVVWLLKGCKTKLKDEIDDDDIRNYIVGVATVGVLLVSICLLFSIEL